MDKLKQKPMPWQGAI
jgi:hypothetical protein